MIKHKSKVAEAREVNQLLLQDSGVIFSVPNVHLLEKKPMAPAKRFLKPRPDSE